MIAKKTLKSKHNIPVVFSTNEKYAKYTSVALESIIENINNVQNFTFYVLYTDLSKKTINNITYQAKKHKMQIVFINVLEQIEKYTLNEREHISRETFYRLLIPDIFKKNNKIIYLDSDLIVNCNLSELYNFDVSNYCVAAVKDIIGLGVSNMSDGVLRKKQYISLHLENYFNYFNAGVLLLNIKNINYIVNSKQLLTLAQKKQFPWQDQDLLNVVFENKILFLDYVWNMSPDPDHFNEIKNAPIEMVKSWKASVNNPKIIHFAGSGNFKPWINKKTPYADLFWKYAKNTPFSKKIKIDYLRFTFLRFLNKIFPKDSKRRSIVKNILKKVNK